MTSDAFEKFADRGVTSRLSVKQKIGIVFICFLILVAVLGLILLPKEDSGRKIKIENIKERYKDHDYEEEYDWENWEDPEDILEEDYDY